MIQCALNTCCMPSTQQIQQRTRQIRKNLLCWAPSAGEIYILAVNYFPFFGGGVGHSLSILYFLCCLLCSLTQSRPTLWNPRDCSLPGSSVHGISQARILEWATVSYSRGSSQPRDQTHVSCISCTSSWILHHYATWEIHTFCTVWIFA